MITPVFVDTNYWIALWHADDRLRERVQVVTEQLLKDRRSLLTTDAVLVEVLNYFCQWRGLWRQRTVQNIRRVLNDPNIPVIHQTKERFLAAMLLYEERPDKEWSHTDCLSMVVMKKQHITEILTDDHHFRQAGFRTLLSDP